MAEFVVVITVSMGAQNADIGPGVFAFRGCNSCKMVSLPVFAACKAVVAAIATRLGLQNQVSAGERVEKDIN